MPGTPSRRAFRSLAWVTRRLDRMHGLSRSTRWARPARSVLIKFIVPLHQPRSREEAIDAVVRGGGLKLHLNTFDLVDRTAYFVGFEPEVKALIRRHVRPGRVAIDIGANIGIHTLEMAKATGTRGRVVSVEANPSMIPRLQGNISLNAMQQVTVLNVAVTAAAKDEVAFYVPSDGRHGGGSSLHAETHAALGGNRRIMIPAMTLDQIAADQRLSGIDLVKIDVEGFEPEVLSGGSAVLKLEHPAVILECTPVWWRRDGHTVEETCAGLRALGYGTFQVVTRQGLAPMPPDLDERADLFITP